MQNDESDSLTDSLARDKKAEDVFRDKGPDLTNPILLLGDDPFDALELCAFLCRWKIKAYVLRQSDDLFDYTPPEDWDNIVDFKPPIVILGHKKWFSLGLISLLADDRVTPKPLNRKIFYEFAKYWIEKDVLDGEVVFRRSPDCYNLTFCSQETLLGNLFARNEIIGSLPFSKGTGLHEALAGVEEFRRALHDKRESFPWPSTVALHGKGQIGSVEWPQIGLLAYLGYHVGVNAKPRIIRRNILGRIYEMPKLPNVNGQKYMDEWGVPHSAKRLKKTAYSIANFCKFAGSRERALMAQAIQNWKDDLAWLKKEYYDGRFDGKFMWPRT